MPADDTAIVLALRAHLLALPAYALTAGTLAATSQGYTRSDGGSFLSDGFAAGMEVVPSGFTQTAPAVITSVSAGAMTLAGGRTAQAAGPGRTLSVGFPSLVAWEGVTFKEAEAAGRWYVDENYSAGPSYKRTFGPRAQMEAQPAYFLNLYSPPGYGIVAPYALPKALLSHFAPETALVAFNGDVVRVRGNPAPFRGLMTTRGGFSVIPVTIPLRLETTNSI